MITEESMPMGAGGLIDPADLDPLDFARKYLGHHCRLPWNRLHEYLFERRRRKIALPLEKRQGELDAVVAPRGAAKSSLMTLAFPLHAVLHGIERYIVIFSATLNQAKSRLKAIRRALQSPGPLKEALGERLAKPHFSATSLEVDSVCIEAYSAGTEVRGISHGEWRPTWIILDDIERSERVHSARHRDQLEDWYREVIENLGDRYTNIDIVGTLLHRDSLLARLLKRPDASQRLFPAIFAEADNQKLWDEWKYIYNNLEDPGRVSHALEYFERQRDAMLQGSDVLWPEKESYYELQALRVKLGDRAFNQEKQNAPESDETGVFNLKLLRRFRLRGDTLVCDPRRIDMTISGYPITADSPEVRLADLTILGFLDPAQGGGKGDYASIATVGIDQHGNAYLLDVWLERATVSRQVEKSYELHERWRYHHFCYESNHFQFMVGDTFEQQRNIRYYNRARCDLPLEPRVVRGKKEDRIAKMSPLIDNGWLLFNEDLPELLIRQIEEFPGGRYDDGPDAAASAMLLAKELGYGIDKSETVARPTKMGTRCY